MLSSSIANGYTLPRHVIDIALTVMITRAAFNIIQFCNWSKLHKPINPPLVNFSSSWNHSHNKIDDDLYDNEFGFGSVPRTRRCVCLLCPSTAGCGFLCLDSPRWHWSNSSTDVSYQSWEVFVVSMSRTFVLWFDFQTYRTMWSWLWRIRIGKFCNKFAIAVCIIQMSFRIGIWLSC